MAISTNLERLSYSSADGSIATGLHRQVINVTAARQLLPEESGALVVFDAAAGAVVTLPTPVEGMQFDFLVKTTITSNSAKVITKTVASEFIVGAIMFGADASASETTLINAFAANGSTHVAVTSNGTTTGGKRGTVLNLTAISATLWAVSGIEVGSGAYATPFATS